jgi:hypothetical protein
MSVSHMLDQPETADLFDFMFAIRNGLFGIEQRETAAARRAGDGLGRLIENDVDRVLAVRTMDVHDRSPLGPTAAKATKL